VTPTTLPRIVLRDIPRAATGVILLAAITINAANIVGRYFFRAPLPWAEEILSFLIIWGVGLGACAVTYERRHLVMDLFSAQFPPRLRLAVDLAILAATVGVCGFAALQAWRIVAIMAQNGQVSITAQVPMTIPYTAFVAGFGLIAIAAIVEAVERYGAPVVASSSAVRDATTRESSVASSSAVRDATTKDSESR
jgi:TRAP-type C4-dicarboxylate transport system permease small subunit